MWIDSVESIISETCKVFLSSFASSISVWCVDVFKKRNSDANFSVKLLTPFVILKLGPDFFSWLNQSLGLTKIYLGKNILLHVNIECTI